MAEYKVTFYEKRANGRYDEVVIADYCDLFSNGGLVFSTNEFYIRFINQGEWRECTMLPASITSRSEAMKRAELYEEMKKLQAEADKLRKYPPEKAPPWPGIELLKNDHQKF